MKFPCWKQGGCYDYQANLIKKAGCGSSQMPQWVSSDTKRPNIIPAVKEYYHRPAKLHKLGTIDLELKDIKQWLAPISRIRIYFGLSQCLHELSAFSEDCGPELDTWDQNDEKSKLTCISCLWPPRMLPKSVPSKTHTILKYKRIYFHICLIMCK